MGKWSLPLNLQNVSPLDPTSFGLPTGVYEVTITDSDSKASNDPSKPPNVVVECVVKDGDHKGSSVSVWMGTDVSKKGVLRSWRGLLESIGAPTAALDAGNLTVGPETLGGKTAYLYIVARNPDEKDSFDQRNFVNKAKADQIKASHAAASGATPNGATPAAAQTPAAAPQPAAGGLRF